MSTTFIETFDGEPARPRAACSGNGWDIQIHSRNTSTFYEPEEMSMQHGNACEAPPAVHRNHSYQDAVFLCRNHLMTAINADGYGVIYLTPARLLDLNHELTVSFDLSSLRMSSRDWVDLWVTPWGDNLALPLDGWLPDLNGPPRNGIHIRMDGQVESYSFRADIFEDGVESEVETCWSCSLPEALASAGRSHSATVRETFVLRLSPGHLMFGVPSLDYWPIDTEIPRLQSTAAVLQLGHHSYAPAKDSAGEPATWHWDNVAVSPSTVFLMIPARERYADETDSVVAFPSAAPDGAMLRFSAICRVSINGVFVSPQVPTLHAEHFNSYFVPIAEGLDSVTVSFEPDDWYEGPCLAKDLAIWSKAN
jgi:hypothetical protein